MSSIITASDLSKRFNSFIAANKISFTIEKKECFGFLGPNGAGKTTTMRMIQGVSPITSGNLKVNGIEANEEPRIVKKKLVRHHESNVYVEVIDWNLLQEETRQKGLTAFL